MVLEVFYILNHEVEVILFFVARVGKDCAIRDFVLDPQQEKLGERHLVERVIDRPRLERRDAPDQTAGPAYAGRGPGLDAKGLSWSPDSGILVLAAVANAAWIWASNLSPSVFRSVN